MRIANLYAGIGGNRRPWGDEHEVVAVEYDPEIAAVYASLHPNDEVIVGDALEYIVNHFQEFDLIWASPACTTHSQYRYNVGVIAKGYPPVIPDMTHLYGLITFLKYHYSGEWVVENVRPYYEPLITPTAKVGRHIVWASFPIDDLALPSNSMRSRNKIVEMEEVTGFDLSEFKIANKRQLLRNCVDEEVSQHILNEYNSKSL